MKLGHSFKSLKQILVHNAYTVHFERMKSQRITKQIATATMEGTRKRGRPRQTLRDEVEEDLNIMGTKNRQEIV
jgi:hypothetical protein